SNVWDGLLRKAKTDSNLWDGCNGTVATIWHTQRRSRGAVAGQDARTQDGTTSTVAQRETARQALRGALLIRDAAADCRPRSPRPGPRPAASYRRSQTGVT